MLKTKVPSLSDECGVLGTRDSALKAEYRAPDDAVDRAGAGAAARTADLRRQRDAEARRPVRSPEGITIQARCAGSAAQGAESRDLGAGC